MPPQALRSKRLLLSIHDVSPARHEQILALADTFERHIGAAAYAMLVVPDFHGEWPLEGHPAFRRWLRSQADRGVEMFLHGLKHLDDAVHPGRMARWKARTLTAREGEFLGLDQAEAARRLREGRTQVEDIIGRPVAGFIAPAWLYGRGAMEAIAAEGFPLAEDHFRVWRPADGRTLARGPVVTYATRTPARLASSLLVSRLATIALGGLPTLRLAVHPHDRDSPAVMREVERALRAHAAARRVARYADLAADVGG